MSEISIEKILLARNRSAFDRILSLMKSLVIKNQAEADASDTKDSIETYTRYEAAYEEADTIHSYYYTETELMEAGFTPLEALRYFRDSYLFQSVITNKTDPVALAFIAKKRKERIESYIELNVYYRQFLGLPKDESEYILVENNDKISEYDPEVIYLHEVTSNRYPKTFTRLYIDREVNKIFDYYSYPYLIFIEKPFTPYMIHNKKQFDICSYKTDMLEDNELNYFFECYTAARDEILLIDYIDVYESNYDSYADIMLLFILSYTFSLYCSKMLERYAARDFTDDEIYDILDSNNLSGLKKLNISLLRNIIDRLPDIKENIGTQSIIDIIFDIVADKSFSFKNYYLEKRFCFNQNNNIILGDNKTYDSYIDLVFREHTVKQGVKTIVGIDKEYDYKSIVMGDDSWGGTQNITSIKAKEQIKDKLKRELLQKDFYSLLTKYFSITKIIDIYKQTIDITNKLGLFYQLNENKNNSLKGELLEYHNLNISAVSIYAAWCLSFGTYNELPDADYIIADASAVEGVMKLRSTNKLSLDALNLQVVDIDLGNGYSRKLGDYFTQEELTKYLVRFKYDHTASINEILNQYEDNYAIIKKIEEKLNNKNNYAEYSIWRTILKANLISKNITNFFDNEQYYSEYIINHDPELWTLIEPVITLSGPDHKAALKNLIIDMQSLFTQYVAEVSNRDIIIAIDDKGLDQGYNVGDIALLFNEFTSYYTQMLKQEFKISNDDPGGNSLVLLYAVMGKHIYFDKYGILTLNEKKTAVKTFLYGKTTGGLELSYYRILHDYILSREDIELLIEKITQRLKLLKSSYNELMYERNKIHLRKKENNTISFTEVAKIKRKNLRS
jgi:hypothetical protein